MLAATMDRLLRYGETERSEASKSKTMSKAFELHCGYSVGPSLKGRFALSVLTVHDDGEQTVEQRLEALVSAGDDFVKDLSTRCN